MNVFALCIQYIQYPMVHNRQDVVKATTAVSKCRVETSGICHVLTGRWENNSCSKKKRKHHAGILKFSVAVT